MEEIRTNRRVGIPSIGLQSVRLPIIGNRSASSAGDAMLKDLKSHMLGWYDVKRQGCTNESLAANPVLKDLSGNNHPLELKNFTFGGLSGIGSYGTDLTKWINYSRVTVINKNKVVVPYTTFSYVYDFRAQEKNIYFKAKCSVDGHWEASNNNGVITICSVKADEIADVYCNSDRLASTVNIRVYFIPTIKQDYTLEILPSYPDSLVFNGTTPSWVYDKSNLKITYNKGYFHYEKDNVLKITNLHGSQGVPYVESNRLLYTNVEEVTINIPSYKVRVSGLVGNQKLIIIRYIYDSNGDDYPQTLNGGNGTYIIEAYNTTHQANSDGTILFTDLKLMIWGRNEGESFDGAECDITVEFLPNYPAPTTNNYGVIPSLTQGAKCMMMDFVPINEKSPENEYQGGCYYDQRQQSIDAKNYAIFSFNDNTAFGSSIAYNGRNSNGTFINGVKNTGLTSLQLLQKRQVVGVNTRNPVNSSPVVGSDETITFHANMAFNSLILFDKELTKEEMKYVMKKLMKYDYENSDIPEPTKIGFIPDETAWGGRRVKN